MAEPTDLKDRLLTGPIEDLHRGYSLDYPRVLAPSDGTNQWWTVKFNTRESREIFDVIEQAASDPSYLGGIDVSRYGNPRGWTAVRIDDDGICESETRIHLIHFAASLGTIDGMQWIVENCREDENILNSRALVEKDGQMRPSSAPISFAIYASKGNAVMWLLEQCVDIDISNAEGYLPLHVIASFAYSADRHETDIETIIAKLVSQRADLSARIETCTGFRAKQRFQSLSAQGFNFDGLTPLQLASIPASGFPDHMLHLLAKSYHSLENSTVFEEVRDVAKSLMDRAPLFLERIERQHGADKFRYYLVKEIEGLAKDLNCGSASHLDLFHEILQTAPLAASMLLKLLMIKPKVSDQQRYPLPARAYLTDRRMECTYQRSSNSYQASQSYEVLGSQSSYSTGRRNSCDSEGPLLPTWGYDDKGTRWHMRFRQNHFVNPFQKGNAYDFNPNLKKKMYEVKVRVLYMPGISTMKTVRILSELQLSVKDLNFYNHLPIYAIIKHMWGNIKMIILAKMLWEIAVLCVLLYNPTLKKGSWQLTIIIAHVLSYILTSIWGLLTCSSIQLSMRCYGRRYLKGRILGVLAMLVFIRSSIETEEVDKLIVNKVRSIGFTEQSSSPVTASPQTLETSLEAWDRVVLATNVLLRYTRIVEILGGLRFIGPLIISVVNSFVPMLGMFAFMTIVFIAFAILFVIFKDKPRSIGFILVYLYETLFLGDANAAMEISGLDIAKEQTLDFGKELYVGGHQEWLLFASSLMAVFGMTFFTVVLLNLTIGMYSTYYEQMEPLAEYYFVKKRASTCLSCMLEPSWRIAAALREWKTARCTTSLSVLILSALYLATLHVGGGLRGSIIAASLLVALTQAIQILCLVSRAYIDLNDHFLWVMYRSDYEDRAGERDQNAYELQSLRQQLAEVKDTQDSLIRVLENISPSPAKGG